MASSTKTKETLLDLFPEETGNLLLAGKRATLKDAIFELFPEERTRLLEEKAEELFPLLIPYFEEIYQSLEEKIEEVDSLISSKGEMTDRKIGETYLKIAEIKTTLSKLEWSIGQARDIAKAANTSIETTFSESLKEMAKNHLALIEKERASRETLKGDTTTEIATLRTEVHKGDKVTKRSLETLKKELKQDITDIIARIASLGGGSMNRSIAVGGNTSVLGKFTDLNIKAGSNVTLTYSDNNTTKYVDLTIASSGGSGFTELPATGSINGLNATFSFTQQPSYIVSDGVWYKVNNGWTWSSPNATMTVAPISDIYGIA